MLSAVIAASAIAIGVLLYHNGMMSLYRQDIRIITVEELSLHGPDAETTYLALLGEVFDVSAGKFYKTGGGYSFFSGKDCSLAFATGDTVSSSTRIADISGIHGEQLLGLKRWLEFYRKDYQYVGKLAGWYYDSQGNPTEKLRAYQIALAQAESEQQSEEAERSKNPNCNSSFRPDEGGFVYCDDGRLPRMSETARPGGEPKKRCGCYLPEEANVPGRNVVVGCEYTSPRCQTKAATPK